VVEDGYFGVGFGEEFPVNVNFHKSRAVWVEKKEGGGNVGSSCVKKSGKRARSRQMSYSALAS
jgi:hypothetical protein